MRALRVSSMVGVVLLTGCSVVAGLGQLDDFTAATDGGDGDGSRSPVGPGGGTSQGSLGSTPGGDADLRFLPDEAGATTRDGSAAGSSAGGSSTGGSSAGGSSTAGSSAGDPWPADDASRPPPDARTASDDANPTPDAPPSMDTGPVGNPGVDAASPDAAGKPDASAWCAAHASSIVVDCHDFDESASAAAGFTSHYFSGNYGSVTSSDFAPGSAPSCLRIASPALSSGSANDQYNDVLPYHDKLEVAFAFRIANYDPSVRDLSLLRISYQNASWWLTLDYYGTSSGGLNEGWTVADGGTGSASHPVPLPAAWDTWNVLDIVVDFKAHTVALSLGGRPAFTAESISNPVESSPALFVQTGLNYLGSPAKAMTIDVDDIIVSTPP